MKYLMIVNNNFKMSWHICNTKREIVSTLIARHLNVLKECNYVSRLVAEKVLVFEIEPNYQQLEISVSPPEEPDIRIS